MSEDNAEVIENAEPTETPEANPAEAAAEKDGWMNKEKWVEAGRDPNEHRSAERFIERGEFIGKQKELTKRMDSMQRDFDERTVAANQMHNQRIEMERAKLTSQRDGYVEDANIAGVQQTQQQIDALQPIETPQPTQDPVYARWTDENPWVNTEGAKSTYAFAQVAKYQSMGKSAEECISSMEQDIAREFPNVQPAPSTAMAEGGSRPGVKQATGKITMNDLTADEKASYKSYPWRSDKVFLQAVTDTRKGK